MSAALAIGSPRATGTTRSSCSGRGHSGWFDLRDMPDKVGLPASLAGQRCLDVGTFDGFWAFAMERRGAAEVVAADVPDPAEWDWPVDAPPAAIAELRARHEAAAGFPIAREALGSREGADRAQRLRARPRGRRALRPRLRRLAAAAPARPGRRTGARARRVPRGASIVDAIDLPLSLVLPRRPSATVDGLGRPWWWRPNRAGLVRMVEAAGFTLEARARTVLMPPGAGQPKATGRAALTHLRSRVGRELLFSGDVGAPHAAIHAR